MAIQGFKNKKERSAIKSARVADRTSKAESACKCPVCRRLKGLRVLQVDDVRINSLLIKGILEEEGCHVEIAENGLEALKMFVSSSLHYYNAILTDITMPVMNGFEAAYRIRALDREDANRVPIIAITGDFGHFLKKSPDCFNANLFKPVKPQVLYDTILSQLDERHVGTPD